LSARAGTEVILRFWQPQLLRVIPQVIDSSLRGFATASLKRVFCPIDPQHPDTALRLMVTNPANSRGPLFKPSEVASLGYLGAAQRAERGRSISEPNREVKPEAAGRGKT
jgi:hypothetical protein